VVRVTTFKKSNEAFWWSLFSAGGVMSALFLPVMVVLCGLVLPWQSGEHDRRAAYEHIHGLVTWWPIRLVLAGVIALSFFHVAHRIRHVLVDLGWRHQTAPLSLVCYGGAIAGAATAVWLILTLPSMPQ
jgi:fumarate reductase subunit D